MDSDCEEKKNKSEIFQSSLIFEPPILFNNFRFKKTKRQTLNKFITAIKYLIRKVLRR